MSGFGKAPIRTWHWHPPSASPENAAGKNARTTFEPLSDERVVVSKPAPIRVKSGAASPTLTTAYVDGRGRRHQQMLAVLFAQLVSQVQD